MCNQIAHIISKLCYSAAMLSVHYTVE